MFLAQLCELLSVSGSRPRSQILFRTQHIDISAKMWIQGCLIRIAPELFDAHFFCDGNIRDGGAGGNAGDGGSDGQNCFEKYYIVVVAVDVHRLVAGCVCVFEPGDPRAQEINFCCSRNSAILKRSNKSRKQN